MSKIIRLSMLIVMASFSGLVFSSSQTGTVTWVKVRDNGLVHFGMTGARTSVSGTCAVNNPGFWVIKDENSQGGKIQVSALIAAQTAKTTIEVVGAGLCTRIGDAEDVRDINVITN